MSLKVRVYHSYYGCDTGCCGHVVEIKDGSEARESFEFTHPYGKDPAVWARSLAEEVIRRYWPDCLPTIDWESLRIEEGSERKRKCRRLGCSNGAAAAFDRSFRPGRRLWWFYCADHLYGRVIVNGVVMCRRAVPLEDAP